MSTKIFVHKPRKLKATKPPDTDIERLFEQMTAQHQERLAKKTEERRIMAELRAEELASRAARMAIVGDPNEKNHCLCPACWAGRTASEVLTADTKLLWRVYRGVRRKRDDLIDDAWIKRQEIKLYEAVQKRARWEKVPATEEHIARAVVRVVKLAFDQVKETEKKNDAGGN